MKKRVLILALLMLVAAGPSFALRFCIVSSDPNSNNGFCRVDEYGGDTCYLAGAGTKCNGTGGWEDQDG